MAQTPDSAHDIKLVVLGGGPGGYAAAFLAADLGMEVTLVDLEANPGGVCLFRGCIPSKALLHIARVLNESREADEMGISYSEPTIDLEKLRKWKDRVVGRLTGGLGHLGRQRKVRYLQGRGRFTGSKSLAVTTADGSEEQLEYDYSILATGSRPATIPSLAIDSPCFMDSTAALRLEDVPAKLLVIGGGYIGLELGTVYAALGSKVSLVEMTTGLLPGADRDLVEYVERRIKKQFEGVYLSTRVTELKEQDGGILATLVGLHVPEPEMRFDRVLLAVGRRPNSEDLGLESTGVTLGERGFVQVDHQRRTTDPAIYAIGDIAGEPMLAHKAAYEARVAVEAIAGMPSAFDPQAIPAVVFTDPEVAWAGLTENEARDQGIPFEIARFPWIASGRATTLERNDGLTKLVLEPRTERILGVGIAGVGAGELIAEGVLAVEMGARVADLMMTIHAHPTLSETLMEAAGLHLGHSSHYIPRQP
jgi:dihydrolipoamide dehydrogenase